MKHYYNASWNAGLVRLVYSLTQKFMYSVYMMDGDKPNGLGDFISVPRLNVSESFPIHSFL